MIAPLRADANHVFSGQNAPPSSVSLISDIEIETTDKWREKWKVLSRNKSRPVTCVTWLEALAFSRWCDHKAGANRKVRLLSHIDWLQVAKMVREKEQVDGEKEANLRLANLLMPSTIGVFEPDPLNLIDFGSNVAVWLSSGNLVHKPNPSGHVWPVPPFAYHIGASYNSVSKWGETEMRACKQEPTYRAAKLGIWLIEQDDC